MVMVVVTTNYDGDCSGVRDDDGGGGDNDKDNVK
jgi:hypothetical protein